MASIPLPALGIRPPEDPGANMMRMVQLASLLKAQPYQQEILRQQAQGAQMENQQRAIQMQQQKALADLYARGAGQAPAAGQTDASDTQPATGAQPGATQPPANASVPGRQQSYPMPSDSDILHAGGPIYGTAILKNMKELQKTNADLQKAASDHQAATFDYLGNIGNAIKTTKTQNYPNGNDPSVADDLLAHAAALPGFGQQAEQLRQQLSANPQMLPQLVDRAIAMSPKQRELAAQEMAAGARKQQADIAARRAGLDIPSSAVYQSSAPSAGSDLSQSPSQTTADPLNIKLASGKQFVIE